MLQTWIHRIKPGYEGRLREWFEQLHARADEVRQSFHASGIRAERALILEGTTGSLLVYVSEVTDPATATHAFDSSTLAVDLEHKRVMEECLEGSLDIVPAYDLVQ